MVQAVFCTMSTGEQLEKSLRGMKEDGVNATSIGIVSRPQDLAWIGCPQSQLNRSLKNGILGGFVVGTVIGFAMLFYISPLHSGWMEWTLPLWEGLGWALFGMIVGSSGVLAKSPLDASLMHHFEEAIRQGKVLLSLRVESRKELDRAAQILYAAGAADMHETDTNLIPA